ncbi:MAG: phosphoenolpyruvate synthase [Gemmataceae bacterium]|jgi:pyruvate,water dikinase|nr:phosphoenolpyruvate synthase [Gemmataceae bacterium]
MASRWIRWFRELSLSDVGLVGGKNASLGELYRELTPVGVRVPNGFAVTAEAYRHFLRVHQLEEVIQRELAGLDTRHLEELAERGRRIREAILSRPLPPELAGEIVEAYRSLCQEAGAEIEVAVRSSATAEDLPTASFAGQQESYLNIRGERGVLEAVQRCMASLFTDRAISYRVDRGFEHMAVALSVGVQRMVRSDLACAGVLFTLDTESGFTDVVLIHSAWGLGESVVKGRVDPDEYMVFKPTLRAGFRPILKRSIGAKQERLIYRRGGGTKAVPTPPEERERLTLQDEEVLTLARWGCLIEEHYSRRQGHWVGMDLEWAKDGRSGELFIVQARPETVHTRRPHLQREVYHLEQKGRLLLQGRSVGEKIGAGTVRVIRDVHELSQFQPGEVLVADMTDPDWEPTMKMAAAIVTNRGGRTCHAAIVSREIGVPCVVGTGTATQQLRTGQEVTVSCAEGEVGKVYDGRLAFRKEMLDLQTLPQPKTRVLVNIGDPDQALALSFLPVQGVGLARIEFIISSAIQVHPLALTRFEQLPPGSERDRIAQLSRHYDPHKPRYFVEKLAEGVGRIAAAFYPREVIVRLSDFKSNEYAHLLGGHHFEPQEENPMLGFRGASRYYDPRYRDGFLLECQAMRQVREEMGLKNVHLMIPFCRTPEEGRKVIEVMAHAGLVRGAEGLKVYVMGEIPTNVLRAAEFAEVFDGFSIGSNDLTQLTLGLDRDSELVAHLFDERDPAVQWLIAELIRQAHQRGRPVSICGQAPSDYPEMVRFLVAAGIDSISLNPDAVLKTLPVILAAEQEKDAQAAGAKKES